MIQATATPAVGADTGDTLSADEVAAFVGINVNLVIDASLRNYLPRYVVEPHRLAWRLSDLRHWDRRGWLPPRGWRPYQGGSR